MRTCENFLRDDSQYSKKKEKKKKIKKEEKTIYISNKKMVCKHLFCYNYVMVLYCAYITGYNILKFISNFIQFQII